MEQVLTNLFNTVSLHLPVISKYYGIARPITTSKGTKLAYCTASPGDCDTGYLQAATPDSSETGISYYEILSSTIERISAGIIRRTYQVKFVMHWNAGKAGYQPCDSTDLILLPAFRCLTSQRNVATGTEGVNASVSINTARIVINQPEIFNQLVYENRAQLYVWPYQAASLTVDISMDVPIGCIPFTAPTPVDCPPQ